MGDAGWATGCADAAGGGNDDAKGRAAAASLRILPLPTAPHECDGYEVMKPRLPR